METSNDLDTCQEFQIGHRSHGHTISGYVEPVVYGHNSTLVGKYVVAWGGYSPGNKPLYLYSYTDNRWQSLALPDSHIISGAVELMFIDSDIVYGVVFDRYGSKWRVAAVDMVLLRRFEVVQTLNTPHLATGTAGAFLESRSEMVLFGGADDDLHVLNMDSKVWSKPEQKGQKPSARANHACCSCGNTLFFAGGSELRGLDDEGLTLYILTVDARSYTWSTPISVTGYSPPNRFMLTLTCSSKNRVFAFGGFEGKQTLDMFALGPEETNGWYSLVAPSGSNGSWTKGCSGSVKTGSSNHSAVQTKDFILLMGGYGFQFPTPCVITPY